MRTLLFLILTAISFSASAAKPPGRCEGELTLNGPTRGLVAYLSALVERQLIADPELVQFIEALDRGELANPISKSAATTNSAKLIHRMKLERLLAAADLEREGLRAWAYSALKEKGRVKEKREEASKETDDLSQKMVFKAIPTGLPYGEQVPGFELMTTPVTQKMWVEVMGENPSYYAVGEEPVSMQVNGKTIRLQPEHPVENVTFWSVLEFANRLSVKHGLTPVYDLTHLSFAYGTRAEDGTLRVENVKGFLEVNATPPDFFAPNGYRLPLMYEIELVRSLATVSRETLEHDWYTENSGGKTQPVGLKEPYRFEAKNGRVLEFYDLDGNVQEWATRSQYLNGSDLGAANDLKPESQPQPAYGLSVTHMSNSYTNGSNAYTNIYTNKRSGVIGFRLARTIK